MLCPVCRKLLAAKRYLFTHLNIQQALVQLINKLVDIIRPDDDLVKDVIVACQHNTAAQQRPDPTRVDQLKNDRDQLSRSIEYTQRNVGVTREDQEEADRNLRQFRSERAKLSAEIEMLSAALAHPIRVPTEEEVRAELSRLEQVLIKAAAGVNPEEAESVREVIKLLTGGRIDLYQQGERRKHHGWLQGRFSVRLIDVVIQRVTGERIDSGQEIEVVIDFIRPEVTQFDEDSERAFALYEKGALDVDIGNELHCHRNKAAKLLRHAAEKRGVHLLDGRTRRKQLDRKRQKPLKHELIADIVEVKLKEGLMECVIAEELVCGRHLIAKAIQYLRNVRGLDIPDGRTRRKLLQKKTRFYSRRRSTPPSDDSSKSPG